MKTLLLFWLLSLILLDAKEIYIKTMTLKQNSSKEALQRLKEHGYSNIYTIKYKNYLRVYIGPFKDISSAKKSLKEIKQNIAKDAFITTLHREKKSPHKTLKTLPYIKITTIKQKYKDKTIKRIKEHGYNNIYTIKYKDMLRVYIGPYTRVTRAKSDLYRVKKELAKDAFITNLEIKEKTVEPKPKPQLPINEPKKAPKSKPQREKQVKKEKQKIIKKTKKVFQKKIPQIKKRRVQDTNEEFFITLYAGGGILAISKEGDISLDRELDENPLTYGVDFGYYLSKDSFITLSYQYSTTQDLYIHNLYASLNYQFDTTLSPYIGLIGGVNMLTWQNYPLDSIASMDSSNSYLIGGVLGSEIKLSKNISLFCTYKYLLSDHTFNLISTTNTATIKIEGEQTLNLGFKFRF